MTDLPEFYLEQIEKALRGDLRFKYLVEEDAQTTIWNLLTMLDKNCLHYSYLDDNMEYKL